MSENIAIAWTNLTVSVRPFLSRDEKVILDNNSGGFAFNSINALMGSSGSGKTTLLKCLNASNKYCFSDDSNVWIPRDMKINKCFIYQNHDQRVMTGLTVTQALTYASKLKNSNESDFNHKEIVSQVMSELLISDIENNLIEKCSGGQIKRYCIAAELTAIRKPHILFLDEPTTGLDSNAAEVLIECLKRLSRSHRMSIITSIHQPNQDLFHMFDSVYVLAKGGVCVYSGLPQNLRQHLTVCHIQCTENQIPIEVLIKITSQDWNEENTIKLKEKTNSPMDMGLIAGAMSPVSKEFKTTKAFKLADFWNLFKRFLFSYYYMNSEYLIQLIVLLTTIIIIVAKFFSPRISQVDGCFQVNSTSSHTCFQEEDQKGLLSQNQGVLFYTTQITLIFMSFIITDLYARSMRIFESELRNGWYNWFAYFFSKYLVDFLLALLFAVIYVLTQQLLVQQIDSMDKIVLFFYLIGLTTVCTQCLSTIFAILFKKYLAMAILVSMTLIGVLATYSNYFFLIRFTPTIIQAITGIFYVKYYFNSLLILLYGFGRCADDQHSRVLIEFGLEEDQALFWNNFHRIIICFALLFSLSLLTFWIKCKNVSFNFPRSFQILSYNQAIIKKKKLNINNNNNNYTEVNYLTKVNENKFMISWTNLTMVIENNLSFKHCSNKLLDNISGYFESNTMNAIMGPSGAGKTTLLKCLNSKGTGYLSNESKIFVQNNARFKTCFIKQNVQGHLLQGLTVKQSLLYASKLKNSRIIKELNHNQIVSDLMSELLISDTADNRVESCSGGEQKRIVIASELTSYIQPSIFFIDEPTSGLDSNAAEVVIECLQRLSRSYEMTVITTIHQPNQDLFQMFDSVYVLAKGGVCVYSGLPQNLRQYLNECHIDCTENQIPIEVLLKVYSEDNIIPRILPLSITAEEELSDLFQKCLTQNMRSIDEIKFQKKRFNLKDLNILLQRTLRHTFIANWTQFTLQLFVFVTLAVMMSVHYKHEMIVPKGCATLKFESGCIQTTQDLQSEIMIKQNIKYHWGILSYTFYTLLTFLVMSFSLQYRTVSNEISNTWYSSGVFILANSLSDILGNTIILIIFCWMMNLYGTMDIYLVYLSMWFLGLICTQSLAQIIAMLFPNPGIALGVSVVVQSFYYQISNGVPFARDLHYSLQLILCDFSHIRMMWECIVLSIYDVCDDNQFSTVLYTYDLKGDQFWPNVIRLIIIAIFWKILSVLVCCWKNNPASMKRRIPQNYQTEDLKNYVKLDMLV